MNQGETATILAILQTAYPNFYRNASKEDAKAARKLWAKLFASEPYELVERAIHAYIASDTKGFPPSIGALKETIRKWQDPYGLGPDGKYGVMLSGFGRTARERAQLARDLGYWALQGENMRLPEAEEWEE